MTEGQQERLNTQIALLLEALPGQPEIQVTFFRPDGKKDGGGFKDSGGCRFGGVYGSYRHAASD